MPGESYLAVLDALHDSPIALTVCRHEAGAAMMADAVARLTDRPGICMVTRGPGASNAMAGIHVAEHDSVPLILFVGQVERGMRGRGAFQEMDYPAVFGSIAKWVVEIDDPARIPEILSRAFHVALQGRPGPGRDRAARGRADRCRHGRGTRRASSRRCPGRACPRWRSCRSCSGPPSAPRWCWAAAAGRHRPAPP